MTPDCFDAIPAAQRGTARAALIAALGSAPLGAITPMTGGVTSASVCRVEVGGRRLVLRIEGEPSPLRNPHQYLSMRIAAEAGIAPRLHYLDANDRVVILEFIKDQPLETYPGGPRGLAQSIGMMLKELQSLPLFP